MIVLVGDGALAAAVHAALDAPDAELLAVPTLVEGRTFELLLDADLVVDASDDAATRYLANDAAAVRGIPMVWADATAGEVGTAHDERGVDYRDAHPEGSPVAGVAGVAAPLEALAHEVAHAVADPVAGRVLAWDGARFAERTVARDPGARRPGSLEERTTIPEPDASSSITAPQLAKLLAGATTLGVHEPVPVLLDVRDDPEVSFVTLPGAVHIPLAQLPARIGELDPEVPTVVYCHHGVRSSRALGMLQKSGFTRIRHLTGGIDAWAVQVDPTLPRY